jgi:alpha-pyrone synthase
MSLAILGLGTAVPGTRSSQLEAKRLAQSLCCRTAEQMTWLPAMYDQTGIDQRYTCLGREVVDDVLNGTRHSGSMWLPTGQADDCGPTTGQRMQAYAREAPPLALAAARRALAASGVRPADITHLVTVSCTGFNAPGVDLALVNGLEMSRAVQRTHIGYMGCHGALNGLRVASAFTGADPGARVLLVAVELCSLHYHYGWDPQKIIANALFADGAAALVGVPAAAAPPGTWRVAGSGSYLVPDTADAMTWTVGDHGFTMTLAKKVPSIIARNLRPWLERWLAGQDLALASVASWAVHPGGPKILDAVEEALGLSRVATAASRAVFAEYGNMSSPTVLFILQRLRERGAPRPCVALGFGPGLNAEAMLVR